MHEDGWRTRRRAFPADKKGCSRIEKKSRRYRGTRHGYESLAISVKYISRAQPRAPRSRPADSVRTLQRDNTYGRYVLENLIESLLKYLCCLWETDS
ncbi:hypothetical protein EVAR_27685_1 [Eumeta japonica]|uniref:Uncharacterized protein n=1 Tax=Eumeta variegata TaxID=151549 RepID=A0A4C1WRK7_EUMVA|nr:hypothetical protein EVAR_27685_1 [Eumeta japonica]